jgi:hypothetical protein
MTTTAAVIATATSPHHLPQHACTMLAMVATNNWRDMDDSHDIMMMKMIIIIYTITCSTYIA